MSTLHCPKEILAALPFYPEGALSEDVRGAVEAHLASCSDCREELQMIQGEAQPTGPVPDADQVYARVVALMAGEELDQSAPHTRRAPPRQRRRGLGGLVRAYAVAATVAVAAGALGALGVGLAFRSGEPVYELASGGRAGDVDVVFRDEATATEIAEALGAVGGEIVAGPGALGRYTIEVEQGADLDQVIATLRAENQGVAKFAERVPREP